MHTPSALLAPDRLMSLYQRDLLDAPKDPALDRITEFAARVLRAPVALLTLVDCDRQFFLSQFGLSGPIAEARQTPLTHSFCQYVVTHGGPFLVNDARIHPLVWDNLATKELNVIAYAGLPLVTPEGQLLGSLAVADVKPRQWTSEDVELLRALAAQVIAELELRAKTAELGAEIKTSQRNDAERLVAARSTVHDLRSPLTGLLLSIEMLPEMGTLSKEQTDLIAMCVRTGAALRKLVDGLLEIHALEQGGISALQRIPISPSRLAAQAFEQVGALAAARSIQLIPLVPNELHDVDVDDEKFTRVLVNLLANAIKFTPRGGQATLSIVEAGGARAPAVVFAVKDNGVGIRISDARRIFKEGVKLNKSAKTRESAGLGLSYCKRVVEAHGGSIWLESVPGKGSTFFVRVPCRNISSPKLPPDAELTCETSDPPPVGDALPPCGARSE